jgi:hypothetical protein
LRLAVASVGLSSGMGCTRGWLFFKWVRFRRKTTVTYAHRCTEQWGLYSPSGIWDGLQRTAITGGGFSEMWMSHSEWWITAVRELKGTVSREFSSSVFHKTTPYGPLIKHTKYFGFCF